MKSPTLPENPPHPQCTHLDLSALVLHHSSGVLQSLVVLARVCHQSSGLQLVRFDQRGAVPARGVFPETGSHQVVLGFLDRAGDGGRSVGEVGGGGGKYDGHSGVMMRLNRCQTTVIMGACSITF